MRIPRAPHRWAVTPRQAVAIQRRLARSVRAVRPRGALRLVARLDSAVAPDGRCYAAAVVWDVERRIVLACAPRYRVPEPTRLADQLVRALSARAASSSA